MSVLKKSQITDLIKTIGAKWGITDPIDQAAFAATIDHESAGLTRLDENLNYSAERLCQVWARRFPNLDACRGYAHNPERLANTVYANRMGNGGVATGDGWRYRGRGAIQITGYSNYLKVAKTLGLTIDQLIAYTQTPQGAIESAAVWWVQNNLNRFNGDMKLVTQAVNGGLTGITARVALFDTYRKLLA
jgi:putative chitinase